MLARIRQWIAVLGVGTAAGLYGHSVLQHCHTLKGMLLWDPATPIFYLLSIIGLAFRFFWARYLVLCFSASMLAIDLSSGRFLPAACCAGLMLLLAGRSMRELFEGRDGRWNRWAASNPLLDRLKLLFVAQSVALGLLYAHRDVLGQFGWTATIPLVVGGLGIGGLVFQETWSALLMLPAIVVESLYLWQLVNASELTVRCYSSSHSLATASVLLAIAVAVSLLLLIPLLVRIWRFVKNSDGA